MDIQTQIHRRPWRQVIIYVVTMVTSSSLAVWIHLWALMTSAQMFLVGSIFKEFIGEFLGYILSIARPYRAGYRAGYRSSMYNLE